MSTEFEPLTPAGEGAAISTRGPKALHIVGWFSVGMAVAAIGVLVSVELRNRYKFSHRTPYDFYASAGERAVSEFGMGI